MPEVRTNPPYGPQDLCRTSGSYTIFLLLRLTLQLVLQLLQLVAQLPCLLVAQVALLPH